MRETQLSDGLPPSQGRITRTAHPHRFDLERRSILLAPAQHLASGSLRTRLSYCQERTAKEVMLEHLGGSIQISAVARQCALSRSHFSRAFKHATGLSPRDWLQLARLTRAKELLERTDFSISRVSLECGFADQSHLTRTFLKKCGMTPGKWRAQEILPQ
jgi:AraC-like DNA-binding protein